MTRRATSTARGTGVPRPHAPMLGALAIGALLGATAAPALAAGSRLIVHEIDGHTGAIAATGAVVQLNEPQATGFDHVRVYQHSGQHYVVLLDGMGGELRIYRIDDGVLGPLLTSYRLGKRFSAMEVGGPSGSPWLVVHSAVDGRIQRYPLGANGVLGAATITTAAEWRDKTVFEAYSVGASWYYFGYDTFLGGGQVRRDTGAAVSDFSGWSLGWRSGDYLETGVNTYRALYKFADHPGDDGGHLKVDRMSATGSILATPFDGTVDRGFTTAEFVTTTVPTLGGPGPRYFLLLYDGALGYWETRELSGTALTAAPAASGFAGLGALDLDTYQDDGDAYAVFVRPQGEPMLSADDVDNYAASIASRTEDQVPGFVSGLSQLGRTLFRQEWGMVNIEDGTPMDDYSFVNVGSVGKMFTTMTILALAEAGEIDLDNPILDYLPFATTGDEVYDYASIHPSMRFLTVRDLLTYTSGITTRCTVRADETLDCMPSLATARPAATCAPNPAIPGDTQCDYDYVNSNYSLLRDAVEKFTNQHSVSGMVDFTRDLWMNGVAMTQATCLDPPGNAAYYDDKPTCAGGWVGHELGTTPSCAAGGWYLPGRELMRFMESVRYQQIVGPEMSAYLLDLSLLTAQGTRTAVGWGPTSSQTACKSGGLDKDDWGGLTARICLREEGVDAYLAINTPKTCESQTSATSIMASAWDDR